MIVGAPMQSYFSTAVFVCALVLASTGQAAAQINGSEFSVGYSYLRDPGSSILAATADDDSFPLGWTAGAARRIWRAVSLAGEVAGHYKRRTTFDEDVSLSYHAFLGGPRAAMTVGRVTEFVQVLAGAVHGRGSAFGTTVTVTDLALQPGGGIDYALNRRFAARLQLDYRWIRGSDGRNAASQFRAVAGLVLH
jgi:hypothetical protein